MTNAKQTSATSSPHLEGVSLAGFFDASPVATFVINTEHVVTYFNKACENLLEVKAADMIGERKLGLVFYNHDRPVLADLIVDRTSTVALASLYTNQAHRSKLIADAYESEGFFPHLGVGGRWLFFTATPLRNADGSMAGAVETLQDITDRKRAEEALRKHQSKLEELIEKRTTELAQANRTLLEDVARREAAETALLSHNTKLNELNAKLSMAQEHLVQSEKLASIGQLAAGVAHEINNPIGYIFSNFGTLEKYLADLFQMLGAYEKAEPLHGNAQTVLALATLRKNIELDFLKEDIPTLMRESREGIVRVRKIVQDLKDFSHVDANRDWQFANLNQGIDSTLNVVNNEVKYKADLVKDYGDIPEVQCMPSQINQVVMNLVVNAAHAMGAQRGKITVRTGVAGDKVWFEVADTGSGIAKEVLPRIFDPFYTTKPVGQGTGLGLSLSYGIVQKHHGSIDVQTEMTKGSTFRVTLPLKQPNPLAADGALPT
ncbi:MAG: ATP-binding protein [Burkholderiaceae bacterium]|nr:ATP-binding protein [Burkholderiaceae bacterium]